MKPERREGDDQRAEPEIGQGEAGDGHHASHVIGGPVRSCRREHSDRDGDDQSQEHRQRRQLDRDRDGFPESGRDGLVREDRIPGVETHQLPEPDQVLLVIRTAESQVLSELPELPLTDVPGLRHEGGERVPRHHAHQSEHDQRGEQQDGNREQEPADHIFVHGRPAPALMRLGPSRVSLLIEP